MTAAQAGGLVLYLVGAVTVAGIVGRFAERSGRPTEDRIAAGAIGMVWPVLLVPAMLVGVFYLVGTAGRWARR